MKTNGKHEVMARTARQSLVFAALVAMVLSIAGIGGAQSGAPAPAAPSVKAATAPAQAPAAPAAKPAKGQHEGITVHGHWVIEVRNPNGELVTHREFENALSPGLTIPWSNGGSFSLPGGASLLSALITGQPMSMPPSWTILLEGPGGLTSAAGAPCQGDSPPENACFLSQNSALNWWQPLCTTPPAPPDPVYSCNLVVSPIGTGPSFTGFQLSGSAIASRQGTVSTVATIDAGACGLGANSVPNCTFLPSSGMVAFTSRNLDGNTVPGDPLPVPVEAQQTIGVTVTISFQ
jgi:hypothetical protein